MKYDFDFDMVNENSLTIIFEQIKKNSVVLEFGPANGRLTKKLKEDLGCKVYLVELDEEAGKEALNYGEDLVVGDAESFEWLERYREIKFDYIIFADILEHLRNPEEVLIQAKHLLKQEGTIILSVPNLAHNAVLIDLFNNKFEYNPVGLLDNTHIHMFTKQSLENMILRAGLAVETRNATYCKVGKCEIVNSVDDVVAMDKTYWQTRDYGEVYQFVYTLRRSVEQLEKEENLIVKSSHDFYIQLFRGDNWEEENSVKRFISEVHGANRFIFDKVGDGRKFRLDPINKSCVVSIPEIKVNSKEGNTTVKVVGSNATMNNNGVYVFLTEDPAIELELQGDGKVETIEVVVEYISIDSKQIKSIVEATKKAGYLYLDESEYNAKVEEIRHHLVDERIQVLSHEINSLKEILDDNKSEKLLMEEKIDSLSAQLEAAKKEILLAEQRYEEMKYAYEQKDQALEGVYRSRSWRYTKILRRS
ncbi:MAG: methyltransferase domain-containing protein [Lachnospiraceae bacterium]|nr:methyltransferase domain-containing protein [Lachnospiraceae bacterium]